MMGSLACASLCTSIRADESPSAPAVSSEGKSESLNGHYEGAFESESMGNMPSKMDITESNGVISGTIAMPQGPHGAMTGTIRGTSANGKVAMTFEMGFYKGSITAGFDGKEISGTWDSAVGGGKANWKRTSTASEKTAMTESAPSPAQNQFAPYEFLLGEWNVASETGGPPVAVQRVRWGPNHSYLWLAGSLLINGKEEPHFEGVLVWNGMHKNLDMLLSVDLRHGLAEEQGTVSVQPDGTVVREVHAVFSEGVHPLGRPVVGPGGAPGHFRQTFKLIEHGKIATSVMRESDTGWVPTFPGSDHLVMTPKGES
jgi:hypothetical protein